MVWTRSHLAGPLLLVVLSCSWGCDPPDESGDGGAQGTMRADPVFDEPSLYLFAHMARAEPAEVVFALLAFEASLDP